MLKCTYKILIAFTLFVILALSTKAQRTFSIDKVFLDSLVFGKYKTFLVSKDFNINFIGNEILSEKRFTPDSLQMNLTEMALRNQYYDAHIRQLDAHWQQMQDHKEDYDWELAVKQNKESRPKLEAAFRKQQREDLDNYDRYLFGYINQLGEKVILIHFDPHEIKYFKAGGESHISNLSIMVYNIETRILNLAGWE